MGSSKEKKSTPKGSLIGSTLKNIRFAWREILGASKKADTNRAANPDVWRANIRACLDEKGGEVSARNRAAGLARSYLEFSPEERLTFLSLLSGEFGASESDIRMAVETLEVAEDELEVERSRRALRQALEPERVRLLRKFNTLHSGPRFLVELRSEVIDLSRRHPKLMPLENDLKDLLRSWFDVGFLELQSISWNSPASLLEKLGEYEAVHRVRSWLDLKNRLDIDRRCFAFFHPCMPDEPLIFIEVALVKGLAVQIQELLDAKAEALEAEDADTAIFYSISNAQHGLRGISFGNFLIKQVVNQLRRELPHLKRFATLSPIPGFVAWVREELREERESPLPSEVKKLKTVVDEQDDYSSYLLSIFESSKWKQDEALSEALKPILLRLCSNYLVKAKRSDGVRALNPVAHFHLSNGAQMEQLNWMADTSAKGMQESAGIMINYLYRLDKIESFHEDYRSKGKVSLSSAVKGLLG